MPIEITITEEDRAKADRFVSNDNCIIATALRRMGYTSLNVRPEDAVVDGVRYDIIPSGGPVYLEAPDISDTWPDGSFYKKEVVGKRLMLIPA